MTKFKETEKDIASLREFKKKKHEEQEKYEELVEQIDLDELVSNRHRDVGRTK